ncbi:Phosphoglycolate phosphatase, chromosomal [Boseongicola aestuarii]|uniref:phosphoglycolate phosphatase n=2 Tax=Boseongicola aestuarii TaxID=1470561 RepID=A0A238J315_9RHOB|nr:Phosphoglycolate phosphatase, chromosomal [Boseongicola aestuarii]
MLPVVFDLDGTLIDSLPDVTKAVNLLLAEEGQPLLPQSVVNTFVGSGEKVLMQRLIAATAFTEADAERLMPRFIAHYKTAALDTRLFPGARSALDRLRAAGVPIGLCTNKPRAPLVPTLEAAGLGDVFGVVVAGDDLPLRKPDPAPLFHCFRALGAETGIYVGDSEVDAETAKRAGVPFVIYVHGIRVSPIEDIPHDVSFEDFAALDEILRTLQT